MFPIIYRAVIYKERNKPGDPILDTPPKHKPPAQPHFETLLKYGHHVRRLRLTVKYDSTARIILDRCLNVKDLHIGDPEPNVDPGELPERNPQEDDTTTRPNILSDTFMQKASLEKFSMQFFHCLPDDYPKSKAFSSLTHFSWNPWSDNVHWSMPNLTHLAVDSCVSYEKAKLILKECKRLKVLAILPCYNAGKEFLAATQEDWQSQAGRDKRLVIIGKSIKDPDGIMPGYGFWEVGSVLVKEGWSLEKAFEDSEGSD